MALEDFIRREYGAMVSSSSAEEAYTQRKKVLSNLKKNKNRDSLQKQREDMQTRREMYSIAKNAGVIASTKDGKELITGTTKEKQDKVLARMQTLSNRQLDAMTVLAKSQGGMAEWWYERQKKKLQNRRADQAMLLNLSPGDLYNQMLETGTSLFDNKGFDLEMKKDYLGFSYRKTF
jgi:hypothetical protein